MGYIFKLTPVYKEIIWGGKNLIKLYNKKPAFSNLAESWEVSCHPSGLSIIENGIHEGKTLYEVLKNNKSLLGSNIKNYKFPLLFKLIDADDNLSVQVHPDDNFAAKENDNGKNEMWFVLDADLKKNAGIYAGFKNNISKEEYKEHIEKGTLENMLNFIPVKKGDAVFIKAGTVHAIGKGVVIGEIQQSSDITYRVYDYDRIDKNNKKRELHIDKAIEATKYFEKVNLADQISIYENKNKISFLPACKSFFTQKINIYEKYLNNTENKSFEIIFAFDGEGLIKCKENEFSIKKGETVFIPADADSYKIMGNISIYRFWVGNFEIDYVKKLKENNINIEKINNLWAE